MKYLRYLLGLLLISAVMVACSNTPPASDSPATPSLAPTQTPGGLNTAPTVAPDSDDLGYPAEEESAIPADSPPEGYPAEPTVEALPTQDPYPGGLVWINYPAGVQCDDEAGVYNNVNDAVNQLRNEGVKIAQFEVVDFAVPDVCGGPTSEHFRIQISKLDVDTAESMGWTIETD